MVWPAGDHELRGGMGARGERETGSVQVVVLGDGSSVSGGGRIMAPEQVREKSCFGKTMRSSSLSVVGFRCLIGRRRFQGEAGRGHVSRVALRVDVAA